MNIKFHVFQFYNAKNWTVVRADNNSVFVEQFRQITSSILYSTNIIIKVVRHVANTIITMVAVLPNVFVWTFVERVHRAVQRRPVL